MLKWTESDLTVKDVKSLCLSEVQQKSTYQPKRCIWKQRLVFIPPKRYVATHRNINFFNYLMLLWLSQFMELKWEVMQKSHAFAQSRDGNSQIWS